MNVKKTLAAGTAALVLAGSALPVSAAGIDFDYVNALKENGTADLILNVEAYRTAYSDLDAAFGDDTNAYIMHYLTTGMYEGRTMGVLFSPLAYAEAYSDIKEAFGDDICAVVNHYVTSGIAENRTAGTAGSYADLAEAEREETQKAGNTESRSTAAAYSSTGSSAAGNNTAAGSSSSSANTGAGSADEHTTSIYTNDEKTLLRVEYYDSPEHTHMIEYSVVTNYDDTTKSYTENIYSCDTNTLKRTNVYVNGALVSSTTY